MILPSGYSTYDYSVSAARKGWGQGWPQCTAGPIVTIVLPISGTRIPVHARIARLLFLILDSIERDAYLCGPYGTWGGQCRAIFGTNTASNHSWWLAFDIRAPWNPYSWTGEHDIPDWAYARLRAYGYGLGIDYQGKKDAMHGEFMGTPDDADIMTALAERAFGNGAYDMTPEQGEQLARVYNALIAEGTGVIRGALYEVLGILRAAKPGAGGATVTLDAQSLKQIFDKLHGVALRGPLALVSGDPNVEYPPSDPLIAGIQGKTVRDVVRDEIRAALVEAGVLPTEVTP